MLGQKEREAFNEVMDKMGVPKNKREWYETMDADWRSISRLRDLGRAGAESLTKLERTGSKALSNLSTGGTVGGTVGGLLGAAVGMIPGLQWAAPILVGGGTFLGSKVGQKFYGDPLTDIAKLNTGRDRGLKEAKLKTIQTIGDTQRAKDMKSAIAAGGTAFAQQGFSEGLGLFKSKGVEGAFSEAGQKAAEETTKEILSQAATGTSSDKNILSLLKDLNKTATVKAPTSKWAVNNPPLWDKVKDVIPDMDIKGPIQEWMKKHSPHATKTAAVTKPILDFDSPEYYTAFVDYANPSRLFGDQAKDIDWLQGINTLDPLTQKPMQEHLDILASDFNFHDLSDTTFADIQQYYPEYTEEFNKLWMDENNPLQSWYGEDGIYRGNVDLRLEKSDLLSGYGMENKTLEEVTGMYEDFGQRSAGMYQYDPSGQMRGEWVNGEWVWNEDFTDKYKGLIKPDKWMYQGQQIKI